MVKNYIIGIALATMCPAIYLTYNIVRETFYQSAANRFITAELQFPESQILSRDISYDKREIKVVLVGKEIPEDQIVAVREKLSTYHLEKTKLTVFQGVGNNGLTDISNIKSLVMEDFYKNSEQQLLTQRAELDSLRQTLASFSGSNWVNEKMGQEMKVLFPEIKTLSVSKSLQLAVDSAQIDTLTFAIVSCRKQPSEQEKKKIEEWLKARTATDKLRLIIE